MAIHQIKISVRNLVEFILKSGDIDNRFTKSNAKEAMQEGTRIHKKIQKQMGSEYRAEVSLSMEFEQEGYSILLEGRADGIMTTQKNVLVDEIKGTYKSLLWLEEPIHVHQAQAMCYAYMYGVQESLEEITIQMTYVNFDSEEIKRFSNNMSMEYLSKWFDELMSAYRKWADFQYQWKCIMIDSIKHLAFPFSFRKGQKELVTDVYRTILRKKTLFIQAPTGVGKTISTIFPALHAVGEGLAEKIFYLTAKSITGAVARETFEQLIKYGYRGKIISLTAKEKMCFKEEMECNPEYCEYAKGHLDRVNDAVYELLMEKDLLSREVLLDQAKKHSVCPFEFALDVSSWCDDIICDYNYVFDPKVYLKRFFLDGVNGEYIFLIDEAHNLVDRGREMYSEKLYKEDFLEMKKILKPIDHKCVEHLSQCNRYFLSYKRECDTYKLIEDELAATLFALMRLAERLDRVLENHLDFPQRKRVVDFYLNVRNFLSIYERLDERYVICAQIEEDERFSIQLFCVDPSFVIQECLNKSRSAIFFSATLLPISFYKSMLSTKKDNYAVYAKTSFSIEQRLLCIANDVSSKFTRRNQNEFEKIADYIHQTLQAKQGNYMVFFPSYHFMEKVYQVYTHMYANEDHQTVEILLQSQGMAEIEREEFLAQFHAKRLSSMAAFCVLGGIFAEGIDLSGERLIGTLIVGTGLPQIGYEREILREYFDHINNNGYAYAYRYPGMNKVLQAAGRVIRSVEDFGVITLLDERFLEQDYQILFPKEWTSFAICSKKEYNHLLVEFWEKVEENNHYTC